MNFSSDHLVCAFTPDRSAAPYSANVLLYLPPGTYVFQVFNETGVPLPARSELTLTVAGDEPGGIRVTRVSLFSAELSHLAHGAPSAPSPPTVIPLAPFGIENASFRLAIGPGGMVRSPGAAVYVLGVPQ